MGKTHITKKVKALKRAAINIFLSHVLLFRQVRRSIIHLFFGSLKRLVNGFAQ